MTELDLIGDYQQALADQDAPRIITTGNALDAYDQAERARWTARGALGRYALYYARHGIPIFPIKPGEKTPFPGSRGFKDATTDEATITAWWDANPGANIAMPTGHVWDVVDVDAPTGPWSLAQNPQLFDDLRTAALGEVLTPSGGWHWYMPVEGVKNGTSLIAGVDLRGDGGYVVIPPSVIHGRHYRWTTVPTTLKDGDQ